jgi:hypothetical protein
MLNKKNSQFLQPTYLKKHNYIQGDRMSLWKKSPKM